MINNGQIACMVLGSWVVPQMKEAGDNADDIAYMPFPITLASGKQAASVGPDYTLVSMQMHLKRTRQQHCAS